MDTFLSRLTLAVLLAVMVTPVASAADLRPLSDPAGIRSLFPVNAKLHLLNVWATWCIPCVAEMPDLAEIDQTFGAEVALAGVSLDDTIPDAKRERAATFLDRQKITFPNAWYTGGLDDLSETLRFSGEIPITIIYDRDGRELWRHQGRIELQKTIAILRGLLKEKR